MLSRSSYQSCPTSDPACAKDASSSKETTIETKGIHKGLHFLICLQILFVTLCSLSVIYVQDSTHSPWLETIYNPQTKWPIPLVGFNVYILTCIAMRCLIPTSRAWTLHISMLIITLDLALLLAFFSALTVCDPMVRVVRDSDLDRVYVLGPSGTASFNVYPTANTQPYILMPRSQVSAIGPGWFSESTPDFFQCASLTSYAAVGRFMVGFAFLNLNGAFIITTFIAHVYKGSFHATAHAVVLYCFVFVAMMNGMAIVVINETMWDWRVFYLGLASAMGASYLATSVLFTPPMPTPPPEKPNPSQLLPKTNTIMPGAIGRAAWICVQPVLALEYYFDKLDEPEAENDAQTPFPDPVAGYHV